jgi:hypothetical protein
MERSLFDVQNGAWFVETIRASGQVIRANRLLSWFALQTTAGQREHKTASDKNKSHQKCLAKQEPSTQDNVCIRCDCASVAKLDTDVGRSILI